MQIFKSYFYQLLASVQKLLFDFSTFLQLLKVTFQLFSTFFLTFGDFQKLTFPPTRDWSQFLSQLLFNFSTFSNFFVTFRSYFSTFSNFFLTFGVFQKLLFERRRVLKTTLSVWRSVNSLPTLHSLVLHSVLSLCCLCVVSRPDGAEGHIQCVSTFQFLATFFNLQKLTFGGTGLDSKVNF